MTLLMTALVAVNLQLDIRIYDSVGVAAAELDHARASAGAILASVGIDPIWRPCHESTCVGPVKPHEVVLRLVTSGPQSAKESLGFAVIDVAGHAGSLAAIYRDRVHALATQAKVDEGELLGRAMAHEIGHMLLGTPTHSRFGLMRAVWASRELERGLPSDWLFSGKEAAELRSRLVLRMRPAMMTEAIVASMADETSDMTGN